MTVTTPPLTKMAAVLLLCTMSVFMAVILAGMTLYDRPVALVPQAIGALMPLAHTAGVPRIIHFVFGLAPEPEFGLLHYLAVKSARLVHKDHDIRLHYHYPAKSKWWRKAARMASLVKVDVPTHVFGHELAHTAHKADIVRMDTLLSQGGIYLDMDVISFFPFPASYYAAVPGIVLGQEGLAAKHGLCNAVIISTAQNPFIRTWRAAYQHFNASEWAAHSVQLPKQMWLEQPESVHVAGYKRFFYPTWEEDDIRMVHNSTEWEFGSELGADGLPVQLVWHAWSQMSYEPYLRNLTVAEIRQQKTSFTRGMMRFMDGETDEPDNEAAE